MVTAPITKTTAINAIINKSLESGFCIGKDKDKYKYNARKGAFINRNHASKALMGAYAAS
jgi:hypothetical protein